MIPWSTYSHFIPVTVSVFFDNKVIIESRFHPQCATYDEYVVFIIYQNLVGIDAVVLAVIYATLMWLAAVSPVNCRGRMSEGTRTRFWTLPDD